MRNRTKQKKGALASLGDTGGATLIMALLALLVAAMVSAVILAAATSTVKQEKLDREFQQCQLDLQSAAQFILDDVVGEGEGSDRKGGISVDLKLKPESDTSADMVIDDVAVHGGIAGLNREFESAVRKVHDPKASADASYSPLRDFTVSLTKSSPGTQTESYDVKMNFVLRKSDSLLPAQSGSGYEVIFTFTSSNGAELFADGKEPVLHMRLSEKANESIENDNVTIYTYMFDQFYSSGESR